MRKTDWASHLNEILLETLSFNFVLSCILQFETFALIPFHLKCNFFYGVVMEKRLSFAFVGESVVEAPLHVGCGDLLHLRFRN